MGEHRKSRLKTHMGCKYEVAMPAQYFQDTIRSQLSSLLEEDALKDTRIILRAGSLTMSSCVLSLLSPVLRTTVCGNFIESIRKEISLDDVEAELLLKLLQFASGKTGLVAEDTEELLELGGLAERLQMDAVRSEIEDILSRALKVENCFQMIQGSEGSGLQHVLKDCCKILLDQFEVISQMEGFLELSEERIGNLLDDDKLWVLGEEDAFEALLRWMTSNGEEVRGEGLLRKIRYGVMSKEYLEGLMSSALLPGHKLLKELAGEALVKDNKKRSEGIWDGVERLCVNWNVSRTKARIVGADVLESPEYVAMDGQGRIVVSDSGLHEIIIFNRDGSVHRRIGSYGGAPGEFNLPTSIAVDQQGHIIVADTENGRIQVLNADGSVERCFAFSGDWIGQPCGVAIDREGHIVVTEWGGRIHVLDADGFVVRRVGSIGAAIGQLLDPGGVAVDGAGRIVVADQGNHRVQVFNPDGSVALCFGSEGSGPGQLKSPDGVAVDSAGRFVVADSGNNRVQVFNLDGSVARVIGSAGGGVGQLRRPCGVMVDGTGRIIVVEAGHTGNSSGNHRVQVF